MTEVVLFFLISNKDLLISKKEKHPSPQGVYRGVTYQIQKLHKSSKSKIEEKGWFLHTEN